MKLAALEAEHDASPVPPVVVLAFAHGRRVLTQATELYYEHAHVHTLKARSFACQSIKHVQSAYKTHVGPAAEKLLLHGAQVFDLLKAEYREHAAPTVEKALLKVQLFAAHVHAHLAKHDTLGEHYRKAHQVATKVAVRLQEGYVAASVHVVRAVDELETLLRGILARNPSTRPYSVKHYPRRIVEALLTLPLIALTIVILGGRKKAPKSKKASASSPASSQTTSSRKHTPSKVFCAGNALIDLLTDDKVKNVKMKRLSCICCANLIHLWLYKSIVANYCRAKNNK